MVRLPRMTRGMKNLREDRNSVGEPVVPCFRVIALLLRASAYDFTALTASASLFMVDIELCVELGKEVFQMGCRGFSRF